MKNLHSLRYRDLRHLSTADELQGRPSAGHIHRFRITNKEALSVTLRCYCSERLIIQDPYDYAMREAKTLNPKTPDKHRFDSVDRKHIRRHVEEYEGNLARDLMQPYKPDGTLNEAYVKTYGVPDAAPGPAD